MRIGNNYDGGYVVYDGLLHETDLLISYDVGWILPLGSIFINLLATKS